MFRRSVMDNWVCSSRSNIGLLLCVKADDTSLPQRRYTATGRMKRNMYTSRPFFHGLNHHIPRHPLAAKSNNPSSPNNVIWTVTHWNRGICTSMQTSVHQTRKCHDRDKTSGALLTRLLDSNGVAQVGECSSLHALAVVVSMHGGLHLS